MGTEPPPDGDTGQPQMQATETAAESEEERRERERRERRERQRQRRDTGCRGLSPAARASRRDETWQWWVRIEMTRLFGRQL